MRLLNFDLQDREDTVVVRGLGHDWDLHNFVDFKVLSLDLEQRELVARFELVTSDEENPWGSRGNRACGCELVFRGIRGLMVSEGEPGRSSQDEMTLESLSLAEVVAENAGGSVGPRTQQMVFELGSARSIRVTADTCELRCFSECESLRM